MTELSSALKTPPTHCPSCGHEFVGDELLLSLVRPDSAVAHAEGGHASGSGDFRFRCGGCRKTQTLPAQQAATLLLEQQTRDLFASITAALRGSAKLQ